MEFKDYYKTLGISRDASVEDIKKAFRRMARKYHPDVSKVKDAEQKMQAVNEANAVLSDPEKRAAYDQLGHDHQHGKAFRPPPGWNAGFEFSGQGSTRAQAAEFSDFFAELFGRHMGAETSSQTHRRMRGEDHHARILLDLEDSYQGATRQLTLRVPRADDHGHMRLVDHQIKVRIPKGVHEGQVIRLAGQGGPGMAGSVAGDLFLEVHFRSHSHYRVEKKDIYKTLPVTPWEAALGATVNIQTPNGQVEVHIPESSQTARKLRLKGRGIPAATPGDLYLELEVVLPPATTSKAKEIYQMMARELAFNPRQNEED